MVVAHAAVVVVTMRVAMAVAVVGSGGGCRPGGHHCHCPPVGGCGVVGGRRRIIGTTQEGRGASSC